MALLAVHSGAQTGVDRAAFDAALKFRLAIGGYVASGRIAEDGRIPSRYPNLVETVSADPAERTRLNVESTDGTLIISKGELMGGSRYTSENAERCGKPYLHIDLSRMDAPAALMAARNWLAGNSIRILNVAGPRASEDREIYHQAREFLEELFAALEE
jgi:hypothetical protein